VPFYWTEKNNVSNGQRGPGADTIGRSGGSHSDPGRDPADVPSVGTRAALTPTAQAVQWTMATLHANGSKKDAE